MFDFISLLNFQSYTCKIKIEHVDVLGSNYNKKWRDNEKIN